MANYTDPYENWKALGRPGGSFEAWQAQQGGGQPQATPAPSQAPSAATPAGGGVPTPAELRAMASSGKWSEDFDRWKGPAGDAQLQRWLDSGLWDPQAQKFRSENDPNGPAIYDKPAECPAGTTFHGSRCVPYAELPAWAGGSYGYGDTGQRAGGAWVDVGGNPLQDMMASFAAPTSQISIPMPSQAQPAAPSSPSPMPNAPMPQTSSLQSMMAPLQGQTQPGGVPQTLGTGWLSGQPPGGGVAGMMQKKQRIGQPQRWF